MEDVKEVAKGHDGRGEFHEHMNKEDVFAYIYSCVCSHKEENNLKEKVVGFYFEV